MRRDAGETAHGRMVLSTGRARAFVAGRDARDVCGVEARARVDGEPPGPTGTGAGERSRDDHLW